MTNIHIHMSKFTNYVCSLLNLIVEPITTEMRCKYLSTVMKMPVVGTVTPTAHTTIRK
jgi:hypothetical protein